MRSNPVYPSIRRRIAARPAGFTLMELLIVVLIIGVLVSIIIPVASKARQHAQAANTRALLANLGTLITTYHGDFNAYPGPLSNMEVYTTVTPGLTAPEIFDGTAPATESIKMSGRQAYITMSENLVLGLNGGLRNVDGEIQYDTAWVGSGPQWLRGTPKKLPAYGENTTKDLSTFNIEVPQPPPPAPPVVGPMTGEYVDGNGTAAADSPVPEYVDRFGEPLPIIYLRARAGSRTSANHPDDNPIVTDGSNNARPGQYDYSQYAAYVRADEANARGTAGNIGVGRQLSKSEYVPVDNFPRQGLGLPFVLTATTDPNSVGYTYPYSGYVALRNHAASGLAGGLDETPKQKDSYILISAGIDRVYGTTDDITNFGSY